MKPVLLLALAASLSACGAEFVRPTEREDLLRQLGPGVHAQMVPEGVRVLNATDSEIRLVVINPYWLGLIGPCTAPTAMCTHLRANADQIVPASQIYGIEDAPTELVVRYWRQGADEPTQISVMRPAS